MYNYRRILANCISLRILEQSDWNKQKSLQTRQASSELHCRASLEQEIARRRELNINIFPCSICCEERAMKPIFDCRHELVCGECFQMYARTHLEQKQIPSCFVSGCRAETITTPGSAFHSLSLDSQTKFKMLKQMRHKPIRHCQVPDCLGFTEDHSCTICSQKHCRNCQRIQHRGKCPKKSISLPPHLNFKTCGVCGMLVEKIGGCSMLTCPECRVKICMDCGQRWSFRHHGCSGVRSLEVPCFFIWESCCSGETDAASQVVFD